MRPFSFRADTPTRQLPGNVRAVPVLAILALSTSISGCGGGDSTPSAADTRAAILGTWTGSAARSTKATGAATYTISFQILKGVAANTVQGPYQISAVIGGKPIVVEFGAFSGSYANHKVTGALTAALDESGFLLPASKPNVGSVSMEYKPGTSRVIDNAAIMTAIFQHISDAKSEFFRTDNAKAMVSNAAALNLKGTTWTGEPSEYQIDDPTKHQGVAISVPGRADLGPYHITTNFTDQDAQNNLSGTITVTLPDGSAFTAPFNKELTVGAPGTLTGNIVDIVAIVPRGTPDLMLPGIGAIKLAERTFSYHGAVNGPTLGGAGSLFCLHLETRDATGMGQVTEAGLARAFGVMPLTDGSDGWFVFGSATMINTATHGNVSASIF